MKEKPKILIVEDDSGVAMAMRLGLTWANCEPKIASSRKKAIEMLELENFDLITLDVNMPDANGFELCLELKQNPRFRKTPVVMISGLCSFEDQQRGLEVGAVDYITKPFTPGELVPRLLSHITATINHA